MNERSSPRNILERYVAVLRLFCELEFGQSIEWTSFAYKREFQELKDAGYIGGSRTTVSMSRDNPETVGQQQISIPSITVDGVQLLAELTDYLESSSRRGRIMATLRDFLWLVVGAILAILGNVFGS